MATGPGVNQGKTAFLEEFLPGNRDADEAAVNEAWRASGNEGQVSESLISKTRSRLKIPKKRGSNVREDVGSKTKKKARPKGANAKAKAQEIPLQPNVRAADTGPSRSSFVAEVLGREPQANLKAVNGAWASAGHEGSISPSIYYKVKKELGVTGDQTPVDTAAPAPSQPEASEVGFSVVVIEEVPQLVDTTESSSVTASGDLGRVVNQVEAGIDDLIFILKVNGGMPEVEAALRAARRLLVRSNGA